MAELHDALTYLAGVEWDDVPQDNDLEQYMLDCFRAGELICNSIPPQPGGTPFADSQPHHRAPNSSQSHKDMHPSAVRPHPPHKDHESLQKQWGKPIKFKPADNPLQVSVYKMAGHDRHGAWFARRSIHEGLGFDKWKRAFLREFPESMLVSGGPGAGAVRGLAADRRLERSQVPGTGRLDVYELSAQFPGPVTPRDFIAMVLGTDDALTDKSAVELNGGKKHVPRHYMVVSKPVEHPDAPLRSGYVRGHYESVEMIREIPLSTARSKSTSNLPSTHHEADRHTRERGRTVGAADTDRPSYDENASADDPELNPVEWLMVTRSDPGGGIPRFLVDRGTPETMIADVHKFFDWACGLDHIPGPDDDLDVQQANSEEEGKRQGQTEGASSPVRTTSTESTQQETLPAGGDQARTAAKSAGQPPQQQGGIMNNITSAIGAGFDTYAPVTVSSMVNSRLNRTQEQQISSDDSSDTSSIDSFLSAEELRRLSTALEQPAEQPGDSADSLSIASGDISAASRDQKEPGPHEKEVLKLAKKRERLDQQLARKRMAEENKLRQSQEREEFEVNRQKAEMERKLKKTEEKHRKEIEKLEAKKAKEARKAEEKRRKKDEQYKMSLVTRERDEFRSQSDMYRRENDLLREQVADLQAQNSLLAQKLGQIGGQETLKTVRNEMGHGRSSSVKRIMSWGSSESVPKSLVRKPTQDSAS